jgi:hypothetical protein
MILIRKVISSSVRGVGIRRWNFCSDDDFKKESRVQVTDENAQEMIKKWVNEYEMVLFMKGTPQMPCCGYSGKVVQILRKYGK